LYYPCAYRSAFPSTACISRCNLAINCIGTLEQQPDTLDDLVLLGKGREGDY
jgi:hypothetical protein